MTSHVRVGHMEVDVDTIVAWEWQASGRAHERYDITVYTGAAPIRVRLGADAGRDTRWQLAEELCERTFLVERQSHGGELLRLGTKDDPALRVDHLSARLRALRTEVWRLRLPDAARFVGLHPPGFVGLKVTSSLGVEEGGLVVSVSDRTARIDLFGAVYHLDWRDIAPVEMASLLFGVATDQLCNARWLELSALVAVDVTGAFIRAEPLASTVWLDGDETDGRGELRSLHGTKDRRLDAAEARWMEARFADARPLRITL